MQTFDRQRGALRRPTRRNVGSDAGYTLIEVMIIVAIVAVLAAIAMPNYTAYVQRSRLTEASAQLSELRTRMEAFFQANRGYGTNGVGCGVPVSTSSSATFTFACYLTNDPGATSQSDTQSFVLHATGAGPMVGFEYTIDHSSGKQTRQFVGRTGLPVACWLRRTSDRC